ncbi:Cation/H+ exchanger, CPA1 family [Trema orientale]|uniref:Cation/H+ exchanger, CPA1 family n=1 Tax=Trema orientale TaxID=63057 RepID=A0A2P5CS22_TREOI|nr:Cation/H+ exchanger, CPA1 family [Trema orientale]
MSCSLRRCGAKFGTAAPRHRALGSSAPEPCALYIRILAPFEFEFWVSEHSNPPRLRAIYLQFSSSSASQIDRVFRNLTPFKFRQEVDRNGESGFAQNDFLLNGFGSKFKEDEGYRPQEEEPSSSSKEEENNVDDGDDLDGVQAAYWGMLDEGRITQSTANILRLSVDEALDFVSNRPLCDWKGDNDVASIVNNESEAEGEEARTFLEDVRVTFPQVLCVVKTRQVTYSVLNHLIDYVQNLEKVGLLEEKEMLHLHDAVQTDWKKLLRNPPLVKIPKIRDMISVHPFMGALLTSVCKPLESSTKEMMKLCGVTLYREGSKPNGIWLISNGMVKWTSKSLKSKHSLILDSLWSLNDFSFPSG